MEGPLCESRRLRLRTVSSGLLWDIGKEKDNEEELKISIDGVAAIPVPPAMVHPYSSRGW